MKRQNSDLAVAVAGVFLLLAPACNDDTSGGDDAGTETDTGSGGSGEPGDPPPPVEGDDELCDAGDEAWVARALPFLRGRKPEGQREVQLYVQLIDQLREAGEAEPRRIVAEGLARGPWYRTRWETFFYEQLKVNRSESKLNVACYAESTPAGVTTELAAFIRDNPALGSDFGEAFTARDVMRSSLLLDDLSPFYRADLFARMAKPLDGANVSAADIDVMRRINYGEIFEDAYLGRKAGCLECHNSADAVTYSANDQFNRHWALEGLFERSIYGMDQGREEQEFYAAFRWSGFVEAGNVHPWGMSASCGEFTDAHEGDLLSVPGYIGGALPDAPHLFDIEPQLQAGFASLADQGLELGEGGEVMADQGMAYLTSVSIANAVWREGQGYPLVLAHRFPRNSRQRDILAALTDNFVTESYSLRALVTDVATHPYFNQAPPASCGASTAYHLDPVFYPFSIDTTDATAQRNGVGDMVHRYTSWVMLDAVSQAMWWDRPQRFGPAGMFFDQPPNQVNFLSAMGIFVKDALPGSRSMGFYGLLYWEDRYGAGLDPGLQGDCTGPVGQQDCAAEPWLDQIVDVAQDGTFTVEELMRAIKDRLLLDPLLELDERPLLEDLTGLSLADQVSSLPREDVLAAARRYAGLLVTTPQYMLDGVAAPARDWSDRVPLFVAGTGIQELCEANLPTLLTGTSYNYTCDSSGLNLD